MPVIQGTNSHDHIEGTAGGDVMNGGAGSDTYVVNSLSDVVVEASDPQGADGLPWWGTTAEEPVTLVRLGAAEYVVRIQVAGAPDGVFSEFTLREVSPGVLGVNGLRVADAAGRIPETVLADGDSVWEYAFQLGQATEGGGTVPVEFYGGGHGFQVSQGLGLRLDGVDFTALPIGTPVNGSALTVAQDLDILLPTDGATHAGSVLLQHVFDGAGMSVLHAHDYEDGFVLGGGYSAMLPLSGANQGGVDYMQLGDGPIREIRYDGSYFYPDANYTVATGWGDAHNYLVRMTLPSGGPDVNGDWSRSGPSGMWLYDTAHDYSKVYLNWSAGGRHVAVDSAHETHYAVSLRDLNLPTGATPLGPRAASQGVDTILSSISLTLPDNVEILRLTGAANLSGSGNRLNNTLVGNDGENVLKGGGGVDLLDGGAGTDTALFDGVRSAYVISTAAGVTTVTGPNGVAILRDIERLQFADGRYTLAGTPIAGAVNGTAHADTLSSTAEAETLNGLGGDDVITGGGGNDAIDGGAGVDTAVFTGALAGSSVSTIGGVTTVRGPDGVDTLVNVERLQFSDGTLIVGAGGGQYFAGGGRADTLTGTEFNDVIEASAGNDVILGGAGADTIDGGLGADTAVYSGDRSAYTITTTGDVTKIVGPDGVDSLVGVERLRFADGLYTIAGVPAGGAVHGGAGADVLGGGPGRDVIDGADGDDVITGGAGDDAISGGAGLDIAVFSGPLSAYTVVTSNGATTVTGPDGVDTLAAVERLQFADAVLIVGAGGGQYFAGAPTADAISGTAFADEIFGQGGDDVVNAQGGDDVVHGGDGDDRIHAGGGVDVLYGGVGADQLTGDAGDQLWGEDGDDVLVAVGSAGAASALLAGGGGVDTAVLRGASGQADLASGVGAVGSTVVTLFGIENVIVEGAGAGMRTVNGNSADNALSVGAPGDDGALAVTFNGLGGDDVLTGGAGDDVLDGGEGLDILSGGAGADRLQGDPGDQLYGGDGDDRLFLTGSSDVATVTVSGGSGVDTAILRGNLVSVNLSLGTGVLASTGLAVSGIENIVVESTGTGTRSVTGDSHANAFSVSSVGDIGAFSVVFNGEGGDDRLSGGAGDDVLQGGTGDDVLAGGAGLDALDGGSGVDQADFSSAAGAVTVNLATGTADDGLGGTDTLTEIENLLGSLHDDTLIGSLGANHLIGGWGGDDLFGGGGDDILAGGAGVDVLNGGAGIDTADYSAAGRGVRAQLNTNASTDDGDGGTDTFSSIENLTGSAFSDVLIGDANANVLRGGLGADTLLGLAGNDVIWGGSGAANTLQGGLGDDRYVLEANDSVYEAAGEGVDTIEARINAYVLAANVENLVFGGTGNFAATGNAQANTITGGLGDDNLRGRGGSDVLNGGAGIDTVDYTLAASAVTARLDRMQATNDGDGATDTFSGVENLIGSNFNDLLIGDAGNNVLNGGVGVDVLLGFAGDDILWGGPAGGNNQLQGGVGNDYYVLEAFDTVVEFAGEGVDTVEARIASYTMRANVENLIYTGASSTFVGAGNTLDNHMTGGAGNDILRGMGGDDTLVGGLGKDEVQMRGLAGEYTVTAEGSGWRITDSVAGRDGSTFVESIEVIRWSNNQVRLLSYPPVAASSGEASTKAGPEVSPLLSDDLFGKDGDAFVLPALGDDLAQILPGLADGKDGLASEVLPTLADRLFAGLELHLAHYEGGMLTLDHEGQPALRDGHDWAF